jgi:glycosyltransferase involved in cell wall biosynthesis
VNKQDNFNPKITIIVPIYQHWGVAYSLIDALNKQTLDKNVWELLIVDNGSDQVPNSSKLPNFVNLYLCSQPGSYSARNMGLSKANGELLIFTDADCRPASDWLETIWNTHKQLKEPALIAGAVKVVKFESDTPNKVETYDIALGLPQALYVKNGYAVTANLAVPRSIFDDVGDFDSTRFSGGDAEFCRRATAMGHKLIYNENAVVYHPARSSWDELSTKLRRVKGGQIRAGKLTRRAMYLIRSFLPPFRAYWRILVHKEFTPHQKITVLELKSRLWLVEMHEVMLLLFGKTPERR